MEREHGERGCQEQLGRHASNELSRAMASKLVLLSTVALLALHEFCSDLSAENCYVTAVSRPSRSISRRLVALPTHRLPAAKLRASLGAHRWPKVFYTRISDSSSYRSAGRKPGSKSHDFKLERARCESREIDDRVEGSEERRHHRARVQLRRRSQEKFFRMRRGMGVDWLHAGWQGLGHLRRRWGTARRRRDLPHSAGRAGPRVASTQ